MFVGNNQINEPLVGNSQKNQLYQEQVYHLIISLQFYPNPESLYNHNSLNESVWESLVR